MVMEYYIGDKKVSAGEKMEHKLQQLKEASSLLEEISGRVAWAEDFANYESIREVLDPVYTAVEQAQDKMDEEILKLESYLEERKERKLGAEIEVEQEFEQNIQYALA